MAFYPWPGQAPQTYPSPQTFENYIVIKVDGKDIKQRPFRREIEGSVEIGTEQEINGQWVVVTSRTYNR